MHNFLRATLETVVADNPKIVTYSDMRTISIDGNTVPKGLFVWNVDKRFGGVRPIEPDTVQHLFQNSQSNDWSLWQL